MKHISMDYLKERGQFYNNKNARELRPDDFDVWNMYSKDAIKLLQMVGFVNTRTNGHLIFEHPNKNWFDYPVLIPKSTNTKLPPKGAEKVISAVCIISYCLRCKDSGFDVGSIN